jgi:hypothetical protein
MALAFAVGAVAAVLAAFGAARAGLPRGRAERALLAALVAVVFLVPFAVRAADVYLRAGFIMEWALVDMRARFTMYQDALAVAAVGLSSPLVALAASVRHAALDRLRPGDERLGDHPRTVGGGE